MSKNNNPYSYKTEKTLHGNYCECIKYYKKIEKIKGKLTLGTKIRTFKGIETINTKEDIERINNAYIMAYAQRVDRLTIKGRDSLISWILKRNEKNIQRKRDLNSRID